MSETKPRRHASECSSYQNETCDCGLTDPMALVPQMRAWLDGSASWSRPERERWDREAMERIGELEDGWRGTLDAYGYALPIDHRTAARALLAQTSTEGKTA